MSGIDRSEFSRRTVDYYKETFTRHGTTPKGVDWNGPESQRINFDQVMKLLPDGVPLEVNDLGCGYGALAEYLETRRQLAQYRGYDVNTEMISAAKSRWCTRTEFTFEMADRPLHYADYGIACGIFTLRLERSDTDCFRYMSDVLDSLHETSRRGFAFNCLTAYSDADKKRQHLYYPDPRDVFDLCKSRYARNVALLHDYGLYAFTMIVRKDVEP